MHTISGILLEIDGIIDLAVEIKFVDNNNPLLIDIYKRFINKIYDLYRALHTLKSKGYRSLLNSRELSFTLV